MVILLREHLHYKSVMEGIDAFFEENPDEKPADYDKLISWVKSKHYQDVKPWDKFTYEELHDPEDGRYPNEYLLVALTEDAAPFSFENFDKLFSLILDTWYCFNQNDAVYDEKTETLTLYTGGWSGNEDIIHALHHMFFAIAGTLEYDRDCPAVWYFRKRKYSKEEDDA